MRDIEFRALDKNNKEMITSEYNDDHYIMTLEHGKPILLEYTGDEFGTYGNVDAVFMQFTGLLDAKGNKVFEGDVIYLAGYGDYICEFPFIDLYEANFEGDIGEIKGNIYQHPHLIKGDE